MFRRFLLISAQSLHTNPGKNSLPSKLISNIHVCFFHNFCCRIQCCCNFTNQFFCFHKSRFYFLITCCIRFTSCTFPFALQLLKQSIHFADHPIHRICLNAILVRSLSHLIWCNPNLICHFIFLPKFYLYTGKTGNILM